MLHCSLAQKTYTRLHFWLWQKIYTILHTGPIYILQWEARWVFKFVFWEKPLEQIVHVYGLSPVWIFQCLSSFDLYRNFFPQYKQTRIFFNSEFSPINPEESMDRSPVIKVKQYFIDSETSLRSKSCSFILFLC